MNIKLASKFGLSLFYLISTVIIEIMTFCMLEIGFFPENFLYDFAFMLMFMGIIFIIPNYLAQYIVSMIILFVQIVLMYVNYTLFHLYGDVFSFDMIKLFNETKQAITSDFTYVWLIVVLLGLAFVLGFIGFHIYKSIRVYRIPFSKNFSIFMIMILLIVQGVGIGVYTQQYAVLRSTANIGDENYVLSDAFLMDSSMLKFSSLKTLGTYGYYVNNIMNVLSNSTNKAMVEKAVKYFNSGETFDSDNSSVFGVSEGDNVIVIMMESLEWYGFTDGTYNSKTFSDELTPNIYKLINEGVIATDFFAKSKTNISEGIGFLGSYPIGKYMEQVTSYSKEPYYGFSMPNVLKELGYETYYLHANEGSYYSRRKTHDNLGFNNLYFGEDALDSDVKWGHWMKEEDFVRSAFDANQLIPESSKDGQKFYSFYTTVSSHGPYVNNEENGDQREYKDEVLKSDWYKNASANYTNQEDLNYLVNYQASIVGLDKAIGAIINKLEEYGIYDETTILLYSDHNAYYHSISNTIKGVQSTNYSDIELNTIPFILKSKKLTDKIEEIGYYDEELNPNGALLTDDRYGNVSSLYNRSIYSTDRFCSAYDIVPTILDILGIEYNINLYGGNSIFADLGMKVDIIKFGDKEYQLSQEEVVAYYSHTGGVYGKYGYTSDLESYNFTFTNDVTYVSYTEKFKIVCKNLLVKLNYISTLYTYGVYTRL